MGDIPYWNEFSRELIFAGTNFRVELIFANWPNSRKLNPVKSKNSLSRKLIHAKCRKFGQKGIQMPKL